MNEADDDRYVSIGYGRYKEKGKEDDDNADVYVKTDSGKYVKSSDQKSDDDGGKPEEPKGKSLGKGDFERDFDDTAGDPDDSWDDEEGRAKPKGKTDADTDDDPIEPEDEPKGKPKSRYKVENKPDFKKTGTFDDGNKKAKSLIRKKLKTLGIKPDKSTGTSVHGFRRTTQKGYVLKSHKKYGEAYKMKIWVDDMYKDKVPEMVDHMREQGFDVRDSSNQSFTINHDDWLVGKFV